MATATLATPRQFSKQRRPIRVEGYFAFVPLTKGLEAKIDIEDLPLVQGRLWFASDAGRGRVYATTSGNKPDGKPRSVRMHRVILGVGDEVTVDHANNDPLDNTRGNLRAGTASQNMANRGRQKNNATGYKGVGIRAGRYRARLHVLGKEHYLGTFDDIIEAAKAYDAAALIHFGEFADLNFSTP
jgi:hypothetical protein